MKKLKFHSAGSRFRVTSSSQRKFQLTGIAIVISAVGLAAVAICLTIAGSSSDLPDRAAEIGDVIAGATLVLAVVAAMVALLAYAVATGQPDLRIQLDFPFSGINEPSFKSTVDDNGIVKADDFKQLTCTVRVRNNSGYSAKNPMIILRLHDMAYAASLPGREEWAVVQFASTRGVTIVQWDGGANYSIHGGSVRTLPALHLGGLSAIPDADPYIDINILADGYAREVRVPVIFKGPEADLSSPPDKYSSGANLWL